MSAPVRGAWTAEALQDLQADLADAGDRVDQLLFSLLLESPISPDLSDLRHDVQQMFGSAPDIVAQPFFCRGGLEGLVIFDENLIDQNLLVLGVLDRLTASGLTPEDGRASDLLERVGRRVAPTGAVGNPGNQNGPQPGETLGALAEQVLTGAAVLCFAGQSAGLSVKIGKIDKRAISEAPSAPSVVGPHEGFIEDAETNLSLIRRRLRTPRLRVEQFHIGTLTRTSVFLLHLKGITDDLLVREARRRMRRVTIDGMLESDVLMELIRDAPHSPVPTMKRSERPDQVVGSLLQGQIAIVVDGSPFALLAPATLGDFLKTMEDYYENWFPVTMVRFIRLAAILLGVLLPAFYVAIVTFHPEFIPPQLLAVIAASRENVPLPALGEVLLLLLLFEIIREAGVRVPTGIGNALTIGGTLVVGEAAVRAGIVSTPVIIITSAVVIAFFAIPDYDMVQFSRFLLYPMLFAAGFLGVFGILFMAFALAFYLTSLRSWGVAFLSPLAPMRPRDWSDAVVRVPWWAMDTRPAITGYTNPVRQAPNQIPHPPRVRR